MAILMMFTVLVVIIPSSKSLEPFPKPHESQDLALLKDEYRAQSGIRQSLLEKLNKFSGKKSQKLVMFKPNNTYQDYSQIAGEKHQRELTPGDLHYISEVQPNHQTTSVISKASNLIEKNSKTSQKSAEILEEWKRIRERRMHFYTTNTTFNDWETFITHHGKMVPQYYRRHTISNENEVTDINSMNNQFLRINDSTTSSSSEYNPRIRKMQSLAVPQNPFDYQQLVTHLNPIQKMMSNQAEATERLPPPPNPKSTEASVHTVKVYPPSQHPSSVDYQDKNMYQNNVLGSGNYQKYGDRYGGIAGFEEKPILQLMSNDYNIDEATYMPEVNSDCTDNPCEIDANPFGSTENERCNSPRLKQIILQDIVQREAEASKQAIYNVCEAEMEVSCNVICGTGFYSYLARATQFSLVSAVDVSCYAFLPACRFSSNFIQKRWIKRNRAKI